MQTPYWEYFLAIEDDLIRTGRYVEFCDANMQTYSIEFARLLLACGSEVDVVLKELCRKLDPSQSPDNINKYRAIITPRLPQFHTFEIGVPRYSMFVKPWEDWGAGTNPPWWGSYNNVKHERSNFYHEATLQNAFSSAAGLLCVLLYYYRLEFPGQRVIDPPPRLLIPRAYPKGVCQQASWSYPVPDPV